MTDPNIFQERLRRLREISGNGPVLILTHDNPDPDGLASGKGLARLLSEWGIESKLFYSGIISRSENKMMHKLLTPEWQERTSLENIDQYSAIAMLDTQPGAGNNSLLNVDRVHIVIDHHQPIRESMKKVPFTDFRPEMGATSSMLFQYLAAAQIEIKPALATALFYGLKTDTKSLSRGASKIDEVAYTKLLEMIDRSLLVQVEQASLSRSFYQALVNALENTTVQGGAVIANLGEMYRPDFGAEIADLLIRLENAKAVMCLGVYKQTLQLSIRTIPLGEDAGDFVQRIIMPPGKAGGHGTMAGGQFPVENNQELDRYILEFSRRFLTLMGEKEIGSQLLDASA